MKKIAIAAALILFASCTKEKLKPTFAGKWCFMEDRTRCIDVAQTNDSVASITFSEQIASPKKGAIVIPYHIDRHGDSIVCTSGNIYPTCFFVLNRTKYDGFIAEWKYGPEQGTVKRMIQ